MKKIKVNDVCEVAGAVAVAVGCFVASVALGFIVSGICLLFFGVALGRGTRN